MELLIVIFIIIAAVIVLGVVLYNRLVRLRIGTPVAHCSKASTRPRR